MLKSCYKDYNLSKGMIIQEYVALSGRQNALESLREISISYGHLMD